MDSDPRIPIRETLATAVKLVGGSLVDDLLSNVANRPKNADYVFPQDNAIGELKCLEQDSTDWFTEQLHVLYDGWVAQGRVPALRAATVRIHLRDLPTDCAYEAVDVIKPVIERRVRDANAQIKATRKALEMPDAHGLLILVNDGNYAFPHETVLNLMSRCLKGGNFSAIKWYMYFAANMPSTLPGFNRDVRVFGSGPRHDGLQRLGLGGLCERLFQSWCQIESQLLGRPFDVFQASDPKIVDSITYRR